MPSLGKKLKVAIKKITPLRATQEEAPSTPQKSRIGELLVHEGYLTNDQFEHVLAVQLTRQPTPPFGKLCIELGLISPDALSEVLSKYYVHVPLGKMLVQLGLVTSEQLQIALALQKKNKKGLGSILVEQGYLASNTLVNVLYQQEQLEKYISRGHR